MLKDLPDHNRQAPDSMKRSSALLVGSRRQTNKIEPPPEATVSIATIGVIIRISDFTGFHILVPIYRHIAQRQNWSPPYQTSKVDLSQFALPRETAPTMPPAGPDKTESFPEKNWRSTKPPAEVIN